MVRKACVLGLGLAFASAGSALADGIITFEGTLNSSCALSVSTAGTLALSADGTILGSEQTGGTSAVLTIVAVGSNQITVGTPTLTDSPAGYTSSGQRIEYSYAGLNGLSGVTSGGFTSTSKQFNATILSTLKVDNHIVNTTGFATGHYATTTVVTCG